MGDHSVNNLASLVDANSFSILARGGSRSFVVGRGQTRPRSGRPLPIRLAGTFQLGVVVALLILGTNGLDLGSAAAWGIGCHDRTFGAFRRRMDLHQVLAQPRN